jgi:hypothetical protein
MADVNRIYPLTIRRNYKHRARMTNALHTLGVVDHTFPYDFFRRHWRDQQAYIEQILKLPFCTRCKVPVEAMDGSLCIPCAESNHRSWQTTSELRQRAIERSQADKPNIPEDMLDTFHSRNADTKIRRMARDYDISELEARSILEEHDLKPERGLDIDAFMRKSRGDK